jgi:small subunit ribosomal protein S2
MKELLEAGVHFGHVTRKWHPKMKRYIFGVRNGIHIIDLQHTLREYKKADAFISDTSVGGGKVLFVGTKRQAQPVIQAAAEKVKMPYVIDRWVGGTLTNFKTMRTRIERLKELDRLDTDVKFQNLTKKERQLLIKEREKLEVMFNGIRDMNELPSALFVVDIKEEKNCIAEAKKLSIPVVALVDTNCDPDYVDFSIPGNDDAVRSIQLFTSKIVESIQEGMDIRESKAVDNTADSALKERLEGEAKSLEESFREDKPRRESAKAKSTDKKDGE